MRGAPGDGAGGLLAAWLPGSSALIGLSIGLLPLLDVRHGLIPSRRATIGAHRLSRGVVGIIVQGPREPLPRPLVSPVRAGDDIVGLLVLLDQLVGLIQLVLEHFEFAVLQVTGGVGLEEALVEVADLVPLLVDFLLEKLVLVFVHLRLALCDLDCSFLLLHFDLHRFVVSCLLQPELLQMVDFIQHVLEL